MLFKAKVILYKETQRENDCYAICMAFLNKRYISMSIAPTQGVQLSLQRVEPEKMSQT